MLHEDISRFLGVFSYPLTSIDFLKEDLLQKYYEDAIHKSHLRKALCNYMNDKYRVYSYDELYQYLQLWYLHNETDCEERNSFDVLFDKLKIFTKCLISQRDGMICYKYWENENDEKFLYGFAGTNKVYLFHNVNLLMSNDILTTLYMVTNNKKREELDGYYGNINVSDMMLDKILEKGVAENHLHAGVASSFLTTWSDLMTPLNQSNYQKFEKTPELVSGENSKQKTKLYIWTASLLRGYLIELLFDCKRHNCGDKCNEECTFQCTNECNIGIPIGNKEQFEKFENQCILEPNTMEDFFLEKWSNLQEFHNFKNWKEDAKSINTNEELLFMYDITTLIESFNDKTDEYRKEMVKTYFISYIRIKNYIYSKMVQQKNILGLDYFQSEYYEKSANMHDISMNLSDTSKWERAFKEQFQNKNLTKLELRGTLKDSEKKVSDDIHDFLRAYYEILKSDYCQEINDEYVPKREFPKVGIVYHLLKKESIDNGLVKVCGRDLQYKNLYEEYKIQIQILKNMRNKYGLDKYMLGIDVASLESAVPTWVFKSIYENARDSETENLKFNQSLCFTFHAGEDFRHIISGLRRMYEVVKYLKFHAGDRIGHGIALGINTTEWFYENQTVVMPRIEALDNYLWIYEIITNTVNDINMSYIENKIHKLSKEIYGDDRDISIQTLISGFKKLYTEKDVFETFVENTSEELNGKDCKYKTNNRLTADDIFHSRQCVCYAKKMNQVVQYKITKHEIDITNFIQEYMQEYINRKGIIIEINPSSNIILGNFDTLDDLHLYNLNNQKCNFGNVITCINSDDPSVFNTNVSNELGYSYFAMIEREVSRENVSKWLEKMRKSGVEASFIRRKISDINILKELEYILKEI